MSNFFLFGMIIFDALTFVACLRYFLKSKNRQIGPLVLWFGSRFLSVLFPYNLRVYMGWKTEYLYSFSVLLEGFLMYYFFLLLLSKKHWFAKFLFMIPLSIFVVEFYFLKHYYNVMYVTHVFYYAFVSALLIWLITREKINQPLQYFINLLLVFHVSVFFFMLNLSFLTTSYNLAAYIYPIFWLTYVVFDLLSILYFRKQYVHCQEQV
ncbi:MAG: hypothetical protein RIS20_1575 [Bacteroidota bacterium]|jgi:hypothetical protein